MVTSDKLRSHSAYFDDCQGLQTGDLSMCGNVTIGTLAASQANVLGSGYWCNHCARNIHAALQCTMRTTTSMSWPLDGWFLLIGEKHRLHSQCKASYHDHDDFWPKHKIVTIPRWDAGANNMS